MWILGRQILWLRKIAVIVDIWYLFYLRLEDLESADLAMKMQQEAEDEESRQEEARMDIAQSFDQNAKRFALNEQMSWYLLW